MINCTKNLLEQCDFAYGSKTVIKSNWPMLCVAVPKLRFLCKNEVKDNPNWFKDFKPNTYEDIMCFGFCIVYSKFDLDEKIKLLEQYLNFVDNWAHIDCVFMTLKVKGTELDRLWEWVIKLTKHKEEFWRRTAVILCMKNFFTDDRIKDTIGIFLSIETGQYYVDMALAWAYSEMFIKQPNYAMDVICQKKLPKFIQNKAIQKTRESFRICKELKEKLLTYKIL